MFTLGDLPDDRPAHGHGQCSYVVQHGLQGNAQPLHDEANRAAFQLERVPQVHVPHTQRAGLQLIQKVQLHRVQRLTERFAVAQRFDHDRFLGAHVGRLVHARKTTRPDQVSRPVNAVRRPNVTVLKRFVTFHWYRQILRFRNSLSRTKTFKWLNYEDNILMVFEII